MNNSTITQPPPTLLKMSKDIDNWSEVFADWKASSLSQTTYCERNNIHFNSFTHQWSRHRKDHVKFTKVVTRNATETSLKSSTITIKLPSGAMIELFNEAALKLVLSVLGDIQ